MHDLRQRRARGRRGRDDPNLDAGDDRDASCNINGLCTNDCEFAFDGVCDDTDFGAASAGCSYGDDCADCNSRTYDRCIEYPGGGTCFEGGILVQCERRPGWSWLSLDVETCSAYETCAQATPGDGASVLQAGFDCTPGASTCSGTTLRQCDATGHWLDTPCGECVPFALGSFCRESAGQVVSGHVAYELRRMNGTCDDWGQLEEAMLGSALVVSIVWDPNDSSYSVFDYATSAADGTYSVRVPANPAGEDRGAIVLAREDEHGAIAYTVANPGLAEAGEHTTGSALTQAALASTGLFAIASPDIVAGPELLMSGSGAVRLFDLEREICKATHSLFGRRGQSLVIWTQPEVTWDCGACASPIETRIGLDHFASSLWIGYGADQDLLVRRRHRARARPLGDVVFRRLPRRGRHPHPDAPDIARAGLVGGLRDVLLVARARR